ncbi:hypothetical protein [Pseudomonas aeruginosa]|uniref:hypothetical protein n=1 Tax=Pseudomonas aeruginosa TaxID=287 RepID=UPI000AEA870B|nr:hypothetical protein [Pseudomonas aeruginosa]
MSEPRPVVTQEMKLAAAQKIVSEQGWPDHCAEQIASEYRRHMDGFDLCKELDKWHSWDTSREDMEVLDEMDNLVDQAHRDAEKAWVIANSIKPELAEGTRIREGVIAGVCEYIPARYKVKENGCTHEGRFLLVKFEDAYPVEEDDRA